MSRGLHPLALILIFLAGFLSSLIAGPPVRAQSCGLDGFPDFPGHQLPLETVPDLGSMNLVDAFPNLPDFSNQTALASPNDGSDRLFVATRDGRIYVFPNDPFVSSATLFADLSNVVVTDGQERGLLGLAFDPDYATNRRFFVNYTSDAPQCGSVGNDGCTQIARYEASALDPNQADPNSAQLILEFPQPGAFHNGGMLAFGPDGMLYASTGDGGGNGAAENSQDLSNLLGSILRLDVRANAPSLIPSDNPFVSTPGARGEIFAYGLRNPWRFSFDRVTGDLFIGDVGEQNREEIDLIDSGSSGGQNFGWPTCEGTANNFGDCASSGTVPPVIEYAHNGSSASVTGGYVYRGSALPELVGAYLYSDPFFQTVWAWDRSPSSEPVAIASSSGFIVSWGEATDGEVFALDLAGGILRLERSGPPSGGTAVFPNLLSETGLFVDTASLDPTPGMLAYDVTAPLWSDNAAKQRWLALPAGRKIGFKASREWDFPVGTVVVKQFDLPTASGGSRRVETRVFVRQLDDWAGVTYRWNASQTDAVLLADGLVESIDLGGGASQDWKYPSRAECLGCHSLAAGRVLGTRTDQLFGERDFGGILQAQLEAWDCRGLFDHSIQTLSRYSEKLALEDGSQDLTTRIRSYVDTNCGVCHQPFGAGRGAMDLRFETAVGNWNAVGVAPEFDDLGLVGALLLSPGNAFQSILWQRQRLLDPNLRMARGTLMPDEPSNSLLFSWIQSGLFQIDTDQDGILDAVDVCPMIPDPLQLDSDLDGTGDLCDPDALPNFAILTQSVPSSAEPGEPITLVGVVQNIGTSPSQSFPITFYLSEDNAFDPAFDPAAGSCWVSPMPANSVSGCSSQTDVMPDHLLEAGETSKTFRWVLCANRSGVARDANPNDGCLVTDELVSVPEPGWTRAIAIALLLMACVGRRADRGLARGTTGF